MANNSLGAIWKFTFSKNTNRTSFTSGGLTLVRSLDINRSGALSVTADKNAITISGGGMSTPVTVAIDSGTGAGFGFFSDHYSHGCSDIGSFRLNGITLTQTNVKTVSEVLKTPEWRDNATKMLVNINDYAESDFQNENDLAQTLMRTINENIHYISWGNAGNQASNTDFISKNNGKGIFINNTNYNNAINQTVAYIESVIDSYQSKQYVVVEEPIIFEVTPSNLRTNTATPEYPNGRWKIVHDYAYFENNMGKYINSDMYQSNLPNTFDKAGKYRIYFADSLVKEVYVHRIPVASFSTVINGTNITYRTNSIDVDTSTDIGYGPGIVEEEWSYRESTASTWTAGKLTSFNQSKIYLIQLRVKDEQGMWSYPITRYLSSSSEKPVADFNYGTNKITKYDTLNIVDGSYDPSGKALTTYSWTLRKNGAVVSTTATPITNFNTANLGIGTYSYTLKVTNSAGIQSDEFTRTFFVEDDTTKPEVIVDVENCDWQRSQTINAIFTDHGSGIDGYRYIINTSYQMPGLTDGAWSGKITNSTATFTLNQTGTYYLHLVGYDIAGNYITKTSGPYKIDSTAPSVTATSPDTAYVQSQNITVNVSDNINLASFKYTVNESSTAPNENSGEWIAGTGTSAALTLNETGIHYLHVIAYDHVGNRSARTFGQYKIDTIKPMVIVNPRHSTWGQSQRVDYAFSDEDSGFNYSRYIISENSAVPEINDDRWSAPDHNAVSSVLLNITEDTGLTYLHLLGYDKAGNYHIETTGIYEIDTVKPTVDIDHESSYWKQSQEVTVSFHDVHSQFSYFQYIINQSQTPPSLNELGQQEKKMNTTGSFTFDVTGLNYLHLAGYDNVGNYITKTYGPYRIDTVAPTITATVPSEAWKQSQEVLIEVEDNSILGEYKYSITTSDTAPNENSGEWTVGTGTSTTLILDSTGRYYIHVIATDVAGNRRAETFGDYKIDTTKPKVDVINPEFSDWKHSQDVLVTFSDEHSGFDYYRYMISKNPEKPELDDDGWSNPVNSHTGRITIDSPGLNYLYLIGYDKTGNYIEHTSGQYKIYMAKPEIIVDVEESDWKQSQTVHALFSEHGSEYNGYKYVINNSSRTPSAGSPAWSETNSSTTAAFSFDTTGIYYLHLMRIDSKGDYIFKTSGPYHIDTQKPVIAATPPKSEYVRLQAVQIYASDSPSGIERYQYLFTTDEAIPDENSEEWTIGFGTQTTAYIYQDGVFNLHILAYDKAGNSTIRTFGPYKIDRTAPGVTADPGHGEWATSHTVTVLFSDSGSGFDGYKYIINSKSQFPESSDGAWSNMINETEGTFTIDLLGVNYLHLIGYDQAENEVRKTFGPYEVDTISPTITATQPKSEYVESQRVIINISDYPVLTDMRFKYMFNTSDTVPNENADGWIEGTGTSATTTLTTTGSYYLHVIATDIAGNQAVRTFGAYKIDSTAPTVVIDLEQSEWSQTKTIHVEFTDEESGFDYYQYILSTNPNMPALDDEAWSRKVVSPSGAFLLDEAGTYYLHLVGYDKVGNYVKKTSVPYLIDKTAPIVTVDPERSDWSTSLTVYVTFNDEESQFSHYHYLINSSYTVPALDDEGWSEAITSDTATFTFNKDGVYYLHLVGYDKAGNYVRKTSGEYQIDTIAPTITATPPRTDWTQLQTIAINVTDNQTLSDFKYVFTTEETAPDEAASGWETSTGLVKVETLDTTGIYYLHVIGHDRAGNQAKETFGPYYIDMTKPRITGYSTAYLNNMVQVSVEAEDEHSGIAFYGMTNQKDQYESIVWQKSNVLEITKIAEYYLYVMDRAGNISAIDGLSKVAVDQFAKPEIMVSPENSSWQTKQEIEITFSPASEIEVDYYQYLISTNPNMPALDYEGWSEKIDQPVLTISLDQTGEYYLHLVGYDKNNNTVTKTYGAYQVDMTAPIVSGVAVGYKNDSVYLTVSASDEGSGVVQYGIRPHSLEDKPVNIAWQESNKIRITQTGKYSIYAMDRVGHVSKVNEKSTVDIKAFHKPTITVNPTSQRWVDELEVTITFQDDYKGIDYYRYKITKSKSFPSLSASGWSEKITRARNTLAFEDTGSYYLHVIAYDKMNNSISKTFGVYQVDNIIPEINKIVSTEKDKKMNLEVIASDQGSGVKDYGIANGGTVSIRNRISWQASNIFDGLENGSYVIYARDYAGNVSKAASVLINQKETIIEIKEVTVSFQANGGTSLNPVSVVKGSKINAPESPLRTGYIFDGWYQDQSLTRKMNFNNPISENMVLYAKWSIDNKDSIPQPAPQPKPVEKQPEEKSQPVVRQPGTPRLTNSDQQKEFSKDESEYSQETVVSVSNLKGKQVEITFIDDQDRIILKQVFNYGEPIYVIDQDGQKLAEYNARQKRDIYLPKESSREGDIYGWEYFYRENTLVIMRTVHKIPVETTDKIPESNDRISNHINLVPYAIGALVGSGFLIFLLIFIRRKKKTTK
ncbi:InlB B-repeat-containing protein [Clostridium formicaceticum]|nr:InlB B-repeat-containing protein [Clostridium formicaceticum]